MIHVGSELSIIVVFLIILFAILEKLIVRPRRLAKLGSRTRRE